MDQMTEKRDPEEKTPETIRISRSGKAGRDVLRILFLLVLIMFWIASVSYTVLNAIGTSYLFRSRLLWEEGEKAEESILEGIYMEEETVPMEFQAYRSYLGKRFMFLYFEFGYAVAKEYYEELGVKYSLYSIHGRRLGGTLPISEENQADVYLFTADAFPDYPDAANYKLKIVMPNEDMEFQLAKEDAPFHRVCLFWEAYPKETVLGLIYGISLTILSLLLLLSRIFNGGAAGRVSLLCRVPVELVVVPLLIGLRHLVPELSMTLPYNMIELKSWIIRGEETFLILLFLICHMAARLREEKWYRRSILMLLYREGVKLAKIYLDLYLKLYQNWEMIWKVSAMAVGIAVAEMVLLCIILPLNQKITWIVLAVCALEKLIVVPYLLYHGLVLTKLSKAAHEVASGNLGYQMTLPAVPGLLKDFSQDMNALADSISIAVEDRMKSERLKTELITNVSHDIKTPLTSIINFSDLIAKEKPENPKVAEYADHLYKQSTRLKKLIEDLMEASKASTGNLETNLELCDVKVLLGQCLGEYEQRLREHKLELIVRQCPESVWIMADTRMLWRIFDNLVNNICKYAQESTRVYLSMEREGDRVRIIFKNVSSYALDVSPEDLMERFVRGDLSRHTEGNGLGLSIVKSLMDLQKAKIALAVDGDLFKAILEFEVTEKPEEIQPGKQTDGASGKSGKQSGKQTDGAPGKSGKQPGKREEKTVEK